MSGFDNEAFGAAALAFIERGPFTYNELAAIAHQHGAPFGYGGGASGHRRADRWLQRMRKAGVVEYVRGQKPHWRKVQIGKEGR